MEWIDRFLDELTLYHTELSDGTALVTEAVRRGWQGNLWHCHLTYSLLADTNVFALACERRAPARDSLWALALRDMGVFENLFRMRLDDPVLMDFRHESAVTKTPAARQLNELAHALGAAGSPEAMLDLLCAFYEAHGAGDRKSVVKGKRKIKKLLS